ncbi:MAG: hypothetical protein JOY62_02090 [Acidobacteriaceae bacterium]|nr:hypothetical protein [Acidobacteriaceae bacterium]MBV9778738.1 hypothetical protein [Acidobacteriaceae bacterium]
MHRSKWTAGLLALVLFCCGAGAGALAYRYFAGIPVSAKNAEDFRHRYISEMQSRVHLTPAQLSHLETILDETKAKYKALRDLQHPAMLKIKEEQISKVKSILSPQQVRAYEQLVAEREQRMREQENRERREEQKRTKAGRGVPSP